MTTVDRTTAVAGTPPAPTIRVPSLLVCDHAQVREGLLFVAGGGVPSFVFSGFPGRIRCHVAVLLEIQRGAAGSDHRVEMYLHDAGAAAVLSSARNVVSVPADAEPGWLVPQVADFTGAEIPRPGRYWVSVAIDDALVTQVSFLAVGVPAGGGE